MIYGFSEKILSDQGHNFKSNLIQELCRLAQVKKLRITPFRPQTNSQSKQFNGTLISTTGTLDPKVKWHWTQEFASLIHAYNCTRNNATVYIPYFLMFRLKPLLPVDIEFGIHMPNVFDASSMKCVAKVQKRMKWAFQKVNAFNEKERNHGQKCYDQNDLVFAHVKAFKGKHKVSDGWENVPYEVVRCIKDDLLVCRLRQKDSYLQSWVLHQNVLFPLIQRHESKSSEVVPVD